MTAFSEAHGPQKGLLVSSAYFFSLTHDYENFLCTGTDKAQLFSEEM